MRNLSIGICSLLISGCVATSSSYKPAFEQIIFTPSTKLVFEVNTGNNLFVEGSYIPGEVITISVPKDMMIPGALLIPFPVHIKGSLKLAKITSDWKYYCGDMDKVAASFPGLGSVIRSGDCVGMRIAADNRKQWIVDNSNYNRGMKTIWSLDVDDAESAKLIPKKIDEPFSIERLKKLTFDGYYGKQIHFTWTETEGKNKNSQKFTFDYPGHPIKIGIKGHQLEVLAIDNIKMTYKWLP